MCTEDSPSGLWRTLGKRVGCKPSGVRIPHPPPPDPGTASGSGVFVACGAAGVPGAAGVLGAVGPGRPRDRHTRACGSEVSISKPARALRTLRCPPYQCRLWCCVWWRVVSIPGQAPPPPTGTAARPCSPRRQASGFCGGRQSGGPVLLSPGLVPLRLRGLRRSLRPGVQPGPRPSQRASIGAGPSRCSSIRPSTPSR